MSATPGVWSLLTPNPTPIVTLAQAKQQTNTVDFADDDALLQTLCGVVTSYLELQDGVTGRALLTQTWQFTAPDAAAWSSQNDPRKKGYPPSRGFMLDRGPLQTVTKVETLQNGAYVELPIASVVSRPLSRFETWLRLASGVAWPIVDQDEAAWRITMTLGYGDAPANLPPALIQAALMLLGHLYQNREAVSGWGSALAETPLGFRMLIAPHCAPGF
jgi:uncharacterized phiE125 gp8 family phage protein